MSILKPYYHRAPSIGGMKVYASVEYQEDTPPDAIAIGTNVFCRVEADDSRLLTAEYHKTGELTGPLRVWIESHERICAHNPLMEGQLTEVANQIEHEHRRRMEQSRRETKRAFARYLRAVIEDYTKGIKRKRPDRVQVD